MEREGGYAFIESLAELLRRLLDYRTVQLGDRDLHMHVMFNLLVRACGWGRDEIKMGGWDEIKGFFQACHAKQIKSGANLNSRLVKE